MIAEMHKTHTAVIEDGRFVLPSLPFAQIHLSDIMSLVSTLTNSPELKS
jgi:hypothetical protein